MKSKAAFLFFLSSLSAATLACSLFSGSTAGVEGSGVKVSDNLPEETYPGDYISYHGYYLAVLQVLDPAPASSNGVSEPGKRNVSLEIVIGNQSGIFSSPFNLSFGGIEDAGGQVHPQLFVGSGTGIAIDLIGFLTYGERVRGWMDFSLPDGSQPVSLQISLLNPAGGWITYSYGLTPPPDGHAPVQADTSREPVSKSAFGKAAEKKGCSLKALQVKDNLDSIPGLFFTMPPQAHVLGVELEIRNTKNKTALIKDLGVLDKDGYVHRMHGSEKIMAQGKLTLDGKDSVQDWIYFVVPSGFEPDSVRLICNSFADPMEDIVLRSALG
jgi:hypothetical protein